MWAEGGCSRGSGREWRSSGWGKGYLLALLELVDGGAEGEEALVRVLDDVVGLQPEHHLDHCF